VTGAGGGVGSTSWSEGGKRRNKEEGNEPPLVSLVIEAVNIVMYVIPGVVSISYIVYFVKCYCIISQCGFLLFPSTTTYVMVDLMSRVNYGSELDSFYTILDTYSAAPTSCAISSSRPIHALP
jgi:hypothetical protein